MKGIVLSGREFDNGYKLFRSGPTTKDLLHSKDVEALVNQGLADVDEDNIVSLSEKGKEYYTQYEKDKEQNLKEQEVEDALINAKQEAIDKIKADPGLAVNADKEEQLPDDSAEAGNVDEAETSETEAETDDTDVEASSTEDKEEEPTEETKEQAQEAFRIMSLARKVALLDYDYLTDVDPELDPTEPVVATEGISDMLSKVMPDINNGFQSILNTINPKGVLGFIFDSNVHTALANSNYVVLARLELPVPEGLQVRYLTYLNSLEGAVERIKPLPTYLDDFTRYVAGILTNHDNRVSTISQDNLFMDLDTSRGAAYAAIASCFSGGTKAKRKYGDLVERNADWTTIESKAKGLIKELNRYDRAELIAKSKHLHSLLVKVEVTAKRGGFDLANPNVLKTLAEGAYQLASELEYLSVIYYRVLALTKCLEQDLSLLKKATSNNPLK